MTDYFAPFVQPESTCCAKIEVLGENPVLMLNIACQWETQLLINVYVRIGRWCIHWLYIGLDCQIFAETCLKLSLCYGCDWMEHRSSSFLDNELDELRIHSSRRELCYMVYLIYFWRSLAHAYTLNLLNDVMANCRMAVLHRSGHD
jgi:hypothetical protein